MTKPTKWSDQDPCCSLAVSLFVIELVSEQHGSLSDCADAQAGLDPCWLQTHYVDFVVARLKFTFKTVQVLLKRQNIENLVFQSFLKYFKYDKVDQS
jgi:hypothetical protein